MACRNSSYPEASQAVDHNSPNKSRYATRGAQFVIDSSQFLNMPIRPRNVTFYVVTLSSSPAQVVGDMHVDSSGSSIEGTFDDIISKGAEHMVSKVVSLLVTMASLVPGELDPTCPDVTSVSPKFAPYLTWDTIGDFMGSDHLPISLAIDSQVPDSYKTDPLVRPTCDRLQLGKSFEVKLIVVIIRQFLRKLCLTPSVLYRNSGENVELSRHHAIAAAHREGTMGIQDLQLYLESGQAEGASTAVDLLRIARTVAQKQRRTGKNSHTLRLVVDGECCLDRLYGGYFSDWACGGQWNRMVQFLAVLVQTVQSVNMELAVFFNGCLEQQRMCEWIIAQQRNRQKINQVLKHITNKGTPPPKIWWTSPVCLRTCLRMALRHLGVSVLCTMDDHHQEVIGYCREYGFHGLVADDGEYAVFDPPRYFSSEQLKLTYKLANALVVLSSTAENGEIEVRISGSLETKEYNLTQVAKGLNLSPDRFFVLAALLGNYLLTEQDLNDFYRKLGVTQGHARVPPEVFVKNIATFVKNLSSVDNLDSVATQVFGSVLDKRAPKLKQSVQYYLNGTKDGFLRYRLQATGRHGDSSGQSKQSTNKGKKNEEDLDTSKFASETLESERESLLAYREATAHAPAPQIVIDPPSRVVDIDTRKSNTQDSLSTGNYVNISQC
uniref:(California timema) hypothetical protein n=1 Tax=Timema californicum TaxID=61474 RepID=A0A7R9PB77_TIMCA|nr:unnamed protein product [Timema californicum]